MNTTNGTRPITSYTIGEALDLLLAFVQHAQQGARPAPGADLVVDRAGAAKLFKRSPRTFARWEAEGDLAEVIAKLRQPGTGEPRYLTAEIVKFQDDPEAFCARHGIPVPPRQRRRRTPRLEG